MVYLLLGMIWALFYQMVALYSPEAFKLPQSLGTYGLDVMQAQLVYFSFVTLTTLGFGDIVAVHATVRMLVILEALMGQLFPAVLLARLVAMELAHRGIDREYKGNGGSVETRP